MHISISPEYQWPIQLTFHARKSYSWSDILSAVIDFLPWENDAQLSAKLVRPAWLTITIVQSQIRTAEYQTSPMDGVLSFVLFNLEKTLEKVVHDLEGRYNMLHKKRSHTTYQISLFTSILFICSDTDISSGTCPFFSVRRRTAVRGRTAPVLHI